MRPSYAYCTYFCLLLPDSETSFSRNRTSFSLVNYLLICLRNTLDKVNSCLPPTMAALQLVPPCQRGGQVSVVVIVRPSPDRVATTPPLQLRPLQKAARIPFLERFHLFAHNFPETLQKNYENKQEILFEQTTRYTIQWLSSVHCALVLRQVNVAFQGFSYQGTAWLRFQCNNLYLPNCSKSVYRTPP